MGALVFVAAVVLVCYLAVRGLATASSWLSGSRFRGYRQVANRYQGRYEHRGMSDPPTVSFSYKGSSVRVGLAPNVPGQVLGPRTRVVARFRQGIPFRLELAPTTRPTPPQPPKGTRLVRVGEPEFDREFVVQANDADMARAFLGPTVRASLLGIQRLAPPFGMLLSINPERLLVQVDRNIAAHPESLMQAVHLSLVVHDGLQEGVSSRLHHGIEIVEAGTASPQESGPPVCKVCLEPITELSVVCATCKTPHHRDCWEFVGACSIYGCHGKQFLAS